jgi:hypothetical protein
VLQNQSVLVAGDRDLFRVQISKLQVLNLPACIALSLYKLRHPRSLTKPFRLNCIEVRAIAQAVSRRHFTAETQVRSQLSLCKICGGQSGTGTAFFPSASIQYCQCHSTGVSLLGQTKILVIIFTTRLHEKPQGCRASLASAAGPFSTKKLY